MMINSIGSLTNSVFLAQCVQLCAGYIWMPSIVKYSQAFFFLRSIKLKPESCLVNGGPGRAQRRAPPRLLHKQTMVPTYHCRLQMKTTQYTFAEKKSVISSGYSIYSSLCTSPRKNFLLVPLWFQYFHTN